VRYADLTKYRYSINYPGRKVFNVGWLGEGRDFPTGDERGLYEKLLPYCAHSIEPKPGVYPCPICGETMPSKQWGTKKFSLGHSEIRVVIEDVWYASPTMILHYVERHHYRPPLDFIRACFHGVDPTSQEYSDALYELQRSAGPRRHRHAKMTAILGSRIFGTTPPPEVLQNIGDYDFLDELEAKCDPS